MAEERKRRTQVTFTQPSRVKRSFQAEADINKIMAKYARTGEMPPVDLKNPLYGDYSDVQDYQMALNKVNAATESFNALPSEVRSRVNNDEAQYLMFIEDEANAEEIISLGIASEEQVDAAWPDRVKPVVEPVVEPVVDPVPDP